MKIRSTILLSLGLPVGGASAASSRTYSPDPIVSGETSHGVSTSTNLPAGNYKIGRCSTKSPGLIPACIHGESIKNFPGGQIEADVLVKYTGNVNAHDVWYLPGQLATFDCKAEGDCEILIDQHETFGKTVHERAPITVVPAGN